MRLGDRARALALQGALLGACAAAQAQTAGNPLLSASGLPYSAPPFDKIHDGDYGPAIDAGIAANQREIDAIANDPAPASFANVIDAMERSGEALDRVVSVFQNIHQSNTDPALDKVDDEEQPKLQALSDGIHLNAKLFARMKSVYEARDHLGLDAKSRFLLERTYVDFVHDGAALSADGQAHLRDLNQQISKLQTSFQQKLLAGTAAGAVVVTDRAKLAGLDEQAIGSAAEAGKSRGHAGAFVLPLRNTTQQPVLEKLSDRALRAQIMSASETRGDADGPNDVRDLVSHLAVLRAQKAELLGFKSFAAYTLDRQMAKSPDAAFKLMDSLVAGATGKARGEAADMQAIIDRDHGGFTLTAYDWPFYSQQVRAQKYQLDEAQTRPYFELDRVLHDGVFFAANKLYGLTFKERHDIPVYEPDVRTFEVFDADGTPIALWYADYFARPNKQGGAWCDDLVRPSGLLGHKPVVVNVASFSKPAPGQPALISFDDVTTMFHEFGHALHTIFSNQHYPSQNGFGVPTDVVEFPSQFNEHWALDPTVLANYAHHYQTGAAMPQEMVDKIKKARTFNQGYMLTEYLAAALLDMEWHSLAADAPLQTPDVFEADALKKHKIDLGGGAAALSHDLLRPYLGRRLCGKLLRLSLGRGAGR